MAPPTYGDLGKSSRDVFGKGYHFGVMKLDLKTVTDTGLEFKSGAVGKVDSGKVMGTLESKYKFREYGVTFTEKWNTDNNLCAIIDIEDQLVKGLKLTFDSSLSPDTGAKSGKIKADYKHETVTVNADVDLNLGGPLANASAVIGHNGWLAGYQMAFDSAKSRVTKNNFGIGFANRDFGLHANINDGQVFAASIYQRVNHCLETGVSFGWNSTSNATNFGIACKYALDRDASIRAKINNSSQLGLSYQQKLRPGVSLTTSAMIDGKNFNQGGHKIGMGLDIEA